MLHIKTVINALENLIRNILNFGNRKYCSIIKQFSEIASCNFRKKEITKMGQNSQNLLEIFAKKWPKDWKIGKSFSQELLEMLLLTNPE